jgi:hypothetical protein
VVWSFRLLAGGFSMCGFELSGLGSDMFGQPLTNAWFPGGDGENGPPVTATGAHIWPTMANAETNGDTGSGRNHGQYGTCRPREGVNKLRGKHCREWIWLLSLDSNQEPFG